MTAKFDVTQTLDQTLHLCVLVRQLSKCMDNILSSKEFNFSMLESLLSHLIDIVFEDSLDYSYFKKNFDELLGHEIIVKIGRIGFTSLPMKAALAFKRFYNQFFKKINNFELFRVYTVIDKSIIKQMSKMLNYCLIESVNIFTEPFQNTEIEEIHTSSVDFLLDNCILINSWFEVLEEDYNQVATTAFNFGVRVNIDIPIRESKWHSRLVPIYEIALTSYFKHSSPTALIKLFKVSEECPLLKRWLIYGSGASLILVKCLNLQNQLSLDTYFQLIDVTTAPLQTLLINDLVESMCTSLQRDPQSLDGFMKYIIHYPKIYINPKISALIIKIYDSVNTHFQRDVCRSLKLISYLCRMNNLPLIYNFLCQRYTSTPPIEYFDDNNSKCYTDQQSSEEFEKIKDHITWNIVLQYQLDYSKTMTQQLCAILGNFPFNSDQVNHYLILSLSALNYHSGGCILLTKGIMFDTIVRLFSFFRRGTDGSELQKRNLMLFKRFYLKVHLSHVYKLGSTVSFN